MVLLSKKEAIKGPITSRNRILTTLSKGIAFLLIPILIIIVDPITLMVNYKLRLAKDTILYNLLQHEMLAGRLSIYMFNITNAEKFTSGEDYKLKVEEVGPFVFQEYRSNIDLEMSEDDKHMGLTPRWRTEFIPEESIAHPRDINLTLPNLPFLSSVALLSNYPSFIRYAFNIMASQIGAKNFFSIDVHSFLWGHKDPLITMTRSLAPGLVTFEHFGLLDRLYENETEYRIVVGATNQDRFKIKSVKKFTQMKAETINYLDERSNPNATKRPTKYFIHIINNVASEQTFEEDTYEGGAFPPMLTPDVPINLFRQGVCKSWHLDYIGSRLMEYGGEALVYTISNRTFINNVNPITLKNYPDGLMDISECLYNLPFVITRTHFLDTDPKLLERIDGLKPDRKAHVNEIVIDRKASITFDTKVSMQLSMMLDDLSSNRETKMLSHSVIPIFYITLNQPKMPEDIMSKFVLVYQIAPNIVLCAQILFAAISLAFLLRGTRLLYLNLTSRTRRIVFQGAVDKKSINAEPLLNDLKTN